MVRSTVVRVKEKSVNRTFGKTVSQLIFQEGNLPKIELPANDWRRAFTKFMEGTATKKHRCCSLSLSDADSTIVATIRWSMGEGYQLSGWNDSHKLTLEEFPNAKNDISVAWGSDHPHLANGQLHGALFLFMRDERINHLFLGTLDTTKTPTFFLSQVEKKQVRVLLTKEADNTLSVYCDTENTKD